MDVKAGENKPWRHYLRTECITLLGIKVSVTELIRELMPI